MPHRGNKNETGAERRHRNVIEATRRGHHTGPARTEAEKRKGKNVTKAKNVAFNAKQATKKRKAAKAKRSPTKLKRARGGGGGGLGSVFTFDKASGRIKRIRHLN